MPEKDAATYRFNPFDLTKVWSQKDYPLIEIGRLVLDRTPENFFADTEQSAFDPGHFVPGIGPSPDRMLQARLVANVAGSFSKVSREDVIARSIEHFRSADADLGARLTEAVRAHRAGR